MNDIKMTRTILMGYRVMYAVVWLVFLGYLWSMTQSLWMIPGVFMAYFLSSARGLIVFNIMKADILGLVNSSEIMLASAKDQIAALERKVEELQPK